MRRRSFAHYLRKISRLRSDNGISADAVVPLQCTETVTCILQSILSSVAYHSHDPEVPCASVRFIRGCCRQAPSGSRGYDTSERSLFQGETTKATTFSSCTLCASELSRILVSTESHIIFSLKYKDIQGVSQYLFEGLLYRSRGCIMPLFRVHQTLAGTSSKMTRTGTGL